MSIINKRSHFDYHIIEEYEAGMVLEGWEVKSIFNKKININNSHVIIRDEELFLINSQFSYENSHIMFDTPKTERNRKLLLKKTEIKKLIGAVNMKGYTLIPIKIIFKNKKYRLIIGLAKGKKEFDKRNQIKIRDTNRDISKALKNSVKRV